MVKTTEVNKVVSQKRTLKFGDKFGLDKDRKKLGARDVPALGTKPEIVSAGKNFSITRIVMTESKKKYDNAQEDGEIARTRIPIAQMDILKEDGTPVKVYSPNSAIVEACQNILADSDFGADKEGFLQTPAEIAEVIEGVGEKNHNYIAFS
jgi:hypothetical protein